MCVLKCLLKTIQTFRMTSKIKTKLEKLRCINATMWKHQYDSARHSISVISFKELWVIKRRIFDSLVKILMSSHLIWSWKVAMRKKCEVIKVIKNRIDTRDVVDVWYIKHDIFYITMCQNVIMFITIGHTALCKTCEEHMYKYNVCYEIKSMKC